VLVPHLQYDRGLAPSILDKSARESELVIVFPKQGESSLGPPRVAIRGVLFCGHRRGQAPDEEEQLARRVSFLVDGFNVYHSLNDASRRVGGSLKWLDLNRLCRSYLHLFRRGREKAELEGVYYFSALATHLTQYKPGVVARHEAYIRALRSIGVEVTLGRFKRRDIQCDACGKTLNRHEEKETDVAIAAKLFELFVKGRCDVAVLVTGDTDLAAAIRTAKTLFPRKEIVVGFPYRRANSELKQLAHSSFRIGPRQYASHQLPDPVLLPDGSSIPKPRAW
jgi:uncharacterized LabA/DUF88 family protein